MYDKFKKASLNNFCLTTYKVLRFVHKTQIRVAEVVEHSIDHVLLLQFFLGFRSWILDKPL